MAQDITASFKSRADAFCQRVGYKLLTREEYQNMPHHNQRMRINCLWDNSKIVPGSTKGEEILDRFLENLENTHFHPTINQVFIEFSVMPENQTRFHYALDVYQFVVVNQ